MSDGAVGGGAGDWGRLMILREAFAGTIRFNDFQKQLDMSSNLLTARLKKLVDRGVLELGPVAQEGRPHEYVLTEMGEDLLTNIVALRQWGDRWLFLPARPLSRWWAPRVARKSRRSMFWHRTVGYSAGKTSTCVCGTPAFRVPAQTDTRSHRCSFRFLQEDGTSRMSAEASLTERPLFARRWGAKTGHWRMVEAILS